MSLFGVVECWGGWGFVYGIRRRDSGREGYEGERRKEEQAGIDIPYL